jgi:hypothetical protein
VIEKLLQQGLEEEYQQYKDQILEFFMNIKGSISIEDLRLYEPIYSSNREKDKCSICEKFANIHCINCNNNNNIWLCIDHWKEHNLDKHT